MRPGVVERVAELDQHVQRHQEAEGVLAAGVVDEVLDRDERAARGQRLVRRADEVLLLLEVPVVQDHAHRDDVRARQRVAKKSPDRPSMRSASPASRDRRSARSARRPAGRTTCTRGADGAWRRRAQSSPVAPPTSHSVEYAGEVELLRERLEVPREMPSIAPMNCSSRAGSRVELLEHRRAVVLDLVLRLAGPQRLGEVVPEAEQPRVQHLEHAADVARVLRSRKTAASGGVAVARCRRRRPRGRGSAARRARRGSRRSRGEQPEPSGDVRAGQWAGLAEVREQRQLDGREQDLRGPEAGAGLQDAARVDRWVGHLDPS